MKSFDRHSLEEQTRLVSRYVAGDLSRSERAEFEAWLVASPELAAEVEMERRLRRGIASAARRGWLNRSARSRDSGRRTPLAHGRRRQRRGVAVHPRAQPRDAAHDPRIASGGRRRAGSRSATASPRIVRLGWSAASAPSPTSRLARTTRRASSPSNRTWSCSPARTAAIELECAGGMAPQTPQYAEYELELVNRRDSTLAWRSTRQLPTSGSRAVVRDARSRAVSRGRLRHDRARAFAGSRGSRRALLAARQLVRG